MTTPPTELELDEIETRAAARRTALSGWINCYSPLSEQETLEDAEAVLGKDVPGLVAEVRRLRPRVAELEVGLNDLAALVSQWHSRSEKAEAALADVRRLVRRLAAHAVGFGDVLDESDRGPWGRTVGADIAELSAAVAPDAASVPPGAPLRPSQPSSVSESAQSPTGAPEGAPRASGPTVAARREQLLEAMSGVSEERTCASWMGDWARTLHAEGGIWETAGRAVGWPTGNYDQWEWVSWDEAARLYGHAVAPSPTTEDPEPADDFTGTRPCGHDDYHDPHPWHGRPDLWCPGIGYDDDQPTA